MKQAFLIILMLLSLTGCWSNSELEDSVIVHGVGMDKLDDKLHVSVEIVKPGHLQQEEEGASASSGDHIVLEETTDTLLEGARELIKYTKRRLDFAHTEAWIIGDKLAKEDMITPLDIIRRDQMLRLNSYIFITKEKPADILNTTTLYENMVASELASSIQQSKFIAVYAPVTMRELFKSIEGPLSSGYLPIIYREENNQQTVTAIDGTAVINGKQMVGDLTEFETAGLNLLLNQVKGGSIQVNLNKNDKVSLEIDKLKTKTIPNLTGNKLDVTIQVKVKGTLADNMTEKEINEDFFKKIENEISEYIESTIQATLNKLQQEFHTDITNIGLETYRKYPKRWRKIKPVWDDIFSNANVKIDVTTNITHQGLINENTNRHKQPYNNPYRFSK